MGVNYEAAGIVYAIVIGLSIPPAALLTVRAYIKGRPSGSRWFLYQQIALPAFVLAGIFAMSTAVANLIPTASFSESSRIARNVVSILGGFLSEQALVILLAALVEVASWFSVLRNQGKPTTYSTWSKHACVLILVVLSALNITCNAMYMDLVVNSVSLVHIGHYRNLSIATSSILAILSLVLLGVSIATLVKSRNDPHMRKASKLFICAAVFNLLPHLYYIILLIYVEVGPPLFGFDAPEGTWVALELTAAFTSWWLPIVTFALLHKLRSRNIKPESLESSESSENKQQGLV